MSDPTPYDDCVQNLIAEREDNARLRAECEHVLRAAERQSKDPRGGWINAGWVVSHMLAALASGDGDELEKQRRDFKASGGTLEISSGGGDEGTPLAVTERRAEQEAAIYRAALKRIAADGPGEPHADIAAEALASGDGDE